MKTTNSAGIGANVIFGAVVCFVSSIAIASLFAWLIAETYISEGSIRYVCAGTLIAGTAAGTAFSAVKAKEKKILVSLLTALLYFLVLISCTAIFFDGVYDGIGVTALCIAGSALCTILVLAKGRKGRKRVVNRRK